MKAVKKELDPFVQICACFVEACSVVLTNPADKPDEQPKNSTEFYLYSAKLFQKYFSK